MRTDVSASFSTAVAWKEPGKDGDRATISWGYAQLRTMTLRYIDLFAGIGGFHLAADMTSEATEHRLKLVMASEIDEACQVAYKANFGVRPRGDITQIQSEDVPDHDLLFAGFPCQPFSIIGGMRGFDDMRGTLFFDIARILEEKRPSAFVLENVKMLVGHQQGRTLARILETLNGLGYKTSYRVLNALDFGVPQKRERIMIVGFRDEAAFLWPNGGIPMKPLKEILEHGVSERYYASETIRASRHSWHTPDEEPTIWHENKAGNVSKLPYSCAMRAGASYNYLLVDGERRMTEREMLRLQGFPDTYKIVGGYSEVRKQAGNSVPVPMVAAVVTNVVRALSPDTLAQIKSGPGQYEFIYEPSEVRDGYEAVTF